MAQYNSMIIGTDLLEKMGLEMSFKDQTMTWDEITIPMKELVFVSQRNHRSIIFYSNRPSTIFKDVRRLT